MNGTLARFKGVAPVVILIVIVLIPLPNSTINRVLALWNTFLLMQKEIVVHRAILQFPGPVQSQAPVVLVWAYLNTMEHQNNKRKDFSGTAKLY